MKRLICGLLISLLLCVPVYAGMETRSLKDAAGTALSSYALTSGSAVYSEKIRLQSEISAVTILVTENKSGGAGDVDISAQYSVDGTNWYTAYLTDMAGAVNADGLIVEAIGNTTQWIVHVPRMAPFLRYKFDPDADSQITVTVIIQEKR